MKKALLSVVCMAFLAVAVAGCCGICPFKKKEAAPTEETQEHGGTEVK